MKRWVTTIRSALESAVGRIIVGLGLSVAAFLVFLKLSHEMLEQETVKFDRAALACLGSNQPSIIHGLMSWITWAAAGTREAIFVAAVVIAYISKRRFWPDGAAILFSTAGGGLLIGGLKRLFHRDRPDTLYYNLGYSFPSGHAFFAVVIFGMLAYIFARDAWPNKRIVVWTIAIILILLVGFSRVYLGEHYPSDVLAGYLVGIPWLWGCTALPKYFAARRMSSNDLDSVQPDNREMPDGYRSEDQAST